MIARFIFLLLLAMPLRAQEYGHVDVVFHIVPDGARLYRIGAQRGAGDFLGTSGKLIPLERRSSAPFYVRVEADGYQTAEVLVGSEVWQDGRWAQQGAWILEPQSLRARWSVGWRHYWPFFCLGSVALLVGARLVWQRRRQLGTLETYLPRAILETLLQEGKGIRPMTMLVSDIADFSTACELHSAQSIATRLDSHYREMAEVLAKWGGCIVHFVGDQFVVLFEGTDHAVRGLGAARAMLARLDELGRLDPNNEHGFYRVRIGIHSGQMALEKRQSSTRVDYAIVGPDSKMAFDVQEQTKSYSVNLLVSAPAAAALQGQAPLAARGPFFEPI